MGMVVRRIARERVMSVSPQMPEAHDTAFHALYDHHCTAAYSLALRLLGDEGVAEEVTREAFLMVWGEMDGNRTDREGILGMVRARVLAHLHDTGGDRRTDAVTIVRLARYGGLTHREIAAELDLTPARVAEQMRVGLTLLRQLPLSA